MWTGDRNEADSAARLRSFAAALKTSRWFVVIWTLAWVGIAVAYLGAVKPEYVASVDVTIEPRLVANDGPEDERHYHQFALDSDQADTQLRVLRSERLLRPVFDQLHLAGSPELADRRDGLLAIVAHALHRLSPHSEPDNPEARAFLAFMSRVRCLRLGLSYVFDISYRAADANTAARVANAIAAAYVADRLVALHGSLERFGGPYRSSRAAALSTQIDKARAAGLDGATLGDLPLADARVLGAALPPLAKTYPKAGPTVIFAAGFAMISGVLLILLAGVPPGASARPRRDQRRLAPPRPGLSV